MNTYHSYLNELINDNHETFRKFESLKWMNSFAAMESENERQKMLSAYSGNVKYNFKETKPWINSLSKGCQLCGQGEWSCLFITGRCNGKCFYCPAPQDNDDLPTAQQMEFQDPSVYADFINYFGFKGCSFSGGEPLLAFDRVLKFLETLREKCSPDLYIWMYTNGILADEQKFKALAHAGLNEIRFDIGATNYNLKGLKKAKGIISNITVEIPAVPEEKENLKRLIPELIESGVTNLNLHQLRLTEYNVNKLQEHQYTYLHGEQPSVYESEMAALDIIRFVDENKLNIGVNYCNFQYKNRFQKAGYRTKVASKVADTENTVTENGFIRKIIVPVQNNVPVETNGHHHHPELYKTISLDDFLKNHNQFEHAIIEYEGIILHNQKNIQPTFEFLNIKNNDYPFERGKPCNPVVIKKNSFSQLISLLKNDGKDIPEEMNFFSIWKHEKIEFGRRDYF